jgi:glycosyltransferase involved in cell wall biosynthesis
MEKKYRIGIDVRDLKKAKTGTFTYLNEIVKALQIEGKGHEIILINYPFKVYTGRNYLLKTIEHLLFFVWKQCILPLICIFKKCDYLLCTDYFLPILRYKTKYYTVFHDCFFFDHPSYYNPIWLAFFKSLGVWGAKKAAGIIVPSNYVKERLGTILPDLRAKIHVVYEGHADFSNTHSTTSSAIEWGLINDFLQKKKYFLYVGTLDKRKNIDRLLEAYQNTPDNIKNNICLIIAGSSPSYKGSDHSIILKRIVKDKKLNSNILFTGRVEQHTLKLLYQHADFLIQPSIDEGFGLPIVEALHFKLPFAAANNTAMPEIGQHAGIYFDPHNTDQIKEAILTLHENDTLKKELIQHAKMIESRYQWDLAARQILDIFISK